MFKVRDSGFAKEKMMNHCRAIERGVAVLFLFTALPAFGATCTACNGLGVVDSKSTRVEVWETSPIMPGDKNWMKGYTDYTWKTGRHTYEGGGYANCSRCGGSGREGGYPSFSEQDLKDMRENAFYVDNVRYVPIGEKVTSNSEIVFTEEGGKKYYGVSGGKLQLGTEALSYVAICIKRNLAMDIISSISLALLPVRKCSRRFIIWGTGYPIFR